VDLPSPGADDAVPVIPEFDRGSAPEPSSPPPARVPPVARVIALAETVLVSGFPTQLFLIVLLGIAGFSPLDASGNLSLGFVVTLSLADAALVITLILTFLAAHGESPRALFLGRRPPVPEAGLGLLLVPVVFFGVAAIVAALRVWLPALHNVAHNPLEALLAERRDTWLFLLVLVVAGGLREEVQRAFVLHRFERYLGGAALGLVLFSLAFGAGHLDQGRDVAVATACLGFFWGIVYLRRRSIVATVTSHAGFNLVEAIRFLLMGG
jgi:membrane protease YdiL (CAAX protease family)